VERKVGWLTFVMGLSRAILRERTARRQFILYIIVALLVMFALGTWPLANWLEETPVRFIFWWAGCFFFGIFLFLLGLYDFLAVMQEMREAKRRGLDE